MKATYGSRNCSRDPANNVEDKEAFSTNAIPSHQMPSAIGGFNMNYKYMPLLSQLILYIASYLPKDLLSSSHDS